MATEFRIAVELSELIGEGTPVTRELFPTLAYAVKAIAEEAQRRWVAYASGAPLPGGKVIRARTGEYARSIMLRQEGDFAAEVYSDLPYAHVIEEGAPERDLKRMLGYSYKVREGAGGKRYLIIPFRWNHPNSVLGHQMPQAVHDCGKRSIWSAASWRRSAGARKRRSAKSGNCGKRSTRCGPSSCGTGCA